jgi:hypothetical protein
MLAGRQGDVIELVVALQLRDFKTDDSHVALMPSPRSRLKK